MDVIYQRSTVFTLQNALVLKAEEWMKKDDDLLTGSIVLPRNLDHQQLLYDQEGMKSYMETWEDYVTRKQEEKRELGDIGKYYKRK